MRFRIHARAVFVIVATTALAALTSDAQEPADAPDVRNRANRGNVMAVTTLPTPARLDAAFRQVPLAPTTSVRLRLVLNAAGNRAWTIVVQDIMGTEVDRVGADDFRDGEYWTNDARGAARVRITGADTGSDVQVVSYGVDAAQAQEQGWIGADNSTEIGDRATPPKARNAAAAVARLRFMTTSSGPSCTGFLLGRDLLMTNHHCVSTDAEMNSTRVEFGADSAGAMPTPFKVLSIEAKSAPLDYSVLRLSGDASRFGRYHIGAAVGEKTDVLIIQHPDGRIKRAAFPPNCVVASPQFVRGIATLVDFRHNCDTLGGSSGSPVLDWAGLQVVGLHHWTYLKGVPGSLNQAVHITFIVDDLKEQVRLKKVKPAVVDELLRPRQPS